MLHNSNLRLLKEGRTVLLRRLAEIATVVSLIFVGLGYFKIEPNILDKLPDIQKEIVENDLKKISLDSTSKNNSGFNQTLLAQFKAAQYLSNDFSKDTALQTVVSNCLVQQEFNVAILAAREISNDNSRSRCLEDIADVALKNSSNKGFAVIAAEIIPNDYARDCVLKRILASYDKELQKKFPAPKEDLLEGIDAYQAIFKFADSSSYMDLSTEAAQEFTEFWIRNYSYKDFLNFKKIYLFADSNSYMGLSEENAKNFALNWFKEKSINDFIFFKEVYLFADSNNYMGLSEEKAKLFALTWTEKIQRDKFEPFKKTFMFADISMKLSEKEATAFAFNKLQISPPTPLKFFFN